MFGPVFRFEAIRTARQGRFYVVRILFGAALLIYLLCEASNWDAYNVGFAPGKVARFAASAFGRFVWAQFLAITALVPALIAGAFGVEEQKRTLADLLASPLSCTSILVDKVAGRLLHVGVGLLLGLPILALLASIGGIEPGLFAVVFGMSAALVLFLGGLSALISVLVLRPGLANLLAYILVLIWLVLPVLLMSIAGAGMMPRYRAVVETAIFHHPLFLLVALSSVSQMRLLSPSPVAWSAWGAGLGLGWSPTVVVGLSLVAHATLGLLAFGLAILVLKARRGGLFARRAIPRFLAAVPRPPIGDDPMLWKERFAPSGGGPSPRAALALAAGLAVGILFYLYEPIKQSIHFAAPLESLVDSVRAAFVFVDLMALCLVAGAASLSIVGERERETWTSLRTTLVTGREIIRAKQFGAIWGMRWLLAGFVLLWGIGLVAGVVSWVGVLATGAGAVVFTWFGAALGVAVSAKARDSGRALGLTALALLLTSFGYLIPALALWNQVNLRYGGSGDAAWMMFGVTPYLEWAALLAPWELARPGLRAAWSPNANPLLAYRGPQVLVSFGLGLAFHLLGGWWLTRWSTRSLDDLVARVGRVPSAPEPAPSPTIPAPIVS